MLRDNELMHVLVRHSRCRCTLTFIGNGTRVVFYERFFQGFCNAMKGLLALGFIDPNPNPLLHPKAADITWVSAHQCRYFERD